MGFTNEKFDTSYLQEMGLAYCSIPVWERKLSKVPYVYRVRFKDRLTIDYIDKQIVEKAKVLSNFYILLDDSLEAYVYHNFEKITDFVKKHGLENKVIYLSAHMEVQAEYDAWCTHNTKEPAIKIIHFNAWLPALRRNVYDTQTSFSDTKTKWYCCLNHRPHYHRLSTIIYLDSLNMLDSGIVTGHDRNYENGLVNTDSYNNYDNYLDYAIKRLDPKYASILELQKDITGSKLPLIYDIPDMTNACQPYLMTPGIFNETLINLVTETFYFNHWNYKSEHFITEKTMKAIVANQIFIIVGPRGILSKIKDMGFKTFSDYFDESYDNEPDSTRLFKAVDTLKYAMTNYSLEELDNITRSVRVKNLKIYNKLDFNINLCKMISE